MDIQTETEVKPVTTGTGSVLKEVFTGRDDKMGTAVQIAGECHFVCEKTLQRCFEKGGAYADLVPLLRDCAQICAVSADFMNRNSANHKLTCSACSEICRRCAEECDKLSPTDESLKLCSEICSRCSATCGEMAAE